MKKRFSLVCMLSILLVFSCSKSEFTDEMPDILDPLDIDINNDGKADYKIEYNHGLILSPTADQRIIGNINPYGLNEVLHNNEDKNLFLRDLDEIKIVVKEPIFWNNIGYTEEIVSITNNADGEWPTSWTVASDMEHSTYFLGLKLVADAPSVIGWIEIEIDKTNGNVSVVNKGIL